MSFRAPYPLRLTPILYDKVWGGDRLARLGKAVDAGATVGESWEFADLAKTSASGAGGGAARSIIANGPLDGKTLQDALELWGEDLLGSRATTPDGTIPLLVKFLDAKGDLSVQVHPSPAYASTHPDAHLKTECWYIIDAEPGAVIYKGIKPGVTREAFAAHIADGTVVDDMIAIPAIVGEMHNLPSGTCHALGAGVLVAEVQTPSDTTFRVYDWGRTGRELHIEQSLECIDFGPAPEATKIGARDAWSRLVTTEFFEVDGAMLSACATLEANDENRCSVLIVTAGGLELTGLGPVTAGETVCVPAGAQASVRGTVDCTVLRAQL